MNDTHFAIGCIWLAAAIGAVVHWHGDRKGLVLFKRAANVTMTAVLVALSAIAWNHPLPDIRQPMAAAGQPISAIDDPPSDALYVASVNKTTYHKLHDGCGHAALIDKKFAVYGYEATQSRQPCRNCFSARPEQPPSQQAKHKPNLEGDERAAE